MRLQQRWAKFKKKCLKDKENNFNIQKKIRTSLFINPNISDIKISKI